ncbi:alpha/beta hydrolase [Rhodococcoides yunnanense]|uniref:Alpha/beta hydrolase family protein n=1 Tax=Rhodococcoides yunnanense TaxID=278209 RepID=A0ABU4BH27_9NOCA|nr:alpha/beta hydrolase family protein [Rhodococcus yunnanensis]MDV6263493.1 alpha/beta hydrolase family protein [Rhodococcus yunnanensis]
MNDRYRLRDATVSALSVLATVVVLTSGTAAVATAETASSVVGVEGIGERHDIVRVHSASMDRDISVDIFRAEAPGAPTLYLLNGAAGGDGGSSWFDQTDIAGFFGDKNVNVVVPRGGAASYYTDWLHDDPVLGRNKWSTFLGLELPPLMDTLLDSNGVNSVAGISMAGTSVLQLAIAHPSVYRSVASYSGCARTSDPVGEMYVRSVVEARGGGSTANMWGPAGSADWIANDPYVNAEGLRGVAVYISSGTGAPGAFDVPGGPGIGSDYGKLAQQLAVGAVIEATTDSCSHQMQQRLQELNIPATYNFRPNGTHSWAYWQQDLHDSWSVIAPSMGLPTGTS